MVTWKSRLGGAIGKAFRQAWKNFWNYYEKENDGGFIGVATKKFIKWPFEGLEPIFIKIYSSFYWVSADVIQQMGCNIGDSTFGKIEEGVNKAIADAKAKIDETRRYLEDNLIAPIQRKTDEMKGKLKQLGINVDSLKIDVGKALSDVSNMKTSISKSQSDIDAFGSKIDSFDSKLRDLNSKASSISTRMGDAESFLADLDRRLKALEEKEWFKLPSIFKS